MVILLNYCTFELRSTNALKVSINLAHFILFDVMNN